MKAAPPFCQLLVGFREDCASTYMGDFWPVVGVESLGGCISVRGGVEVQGKHCRSVHPWPSPWSSGPGGDCRCCWRSWLRKQGGQGPGWPFGGRFPGVDPPGTDALLPPTVEPNLTSAEGQFCSESVPWPGTLPGWARSACLLRDFAFPRSGRGWSLTLLDPLLRINAHLLVAPSVAEIMLQL